MEVVQIVSNPVWGGGERYVLDLSCTLRSDGHRVHLLLRPKAHPVRERFSRDGFTLVAMPMRGLWRSLGVRRLSKFLETLTGPVVVHVHNFVDARFAAAARRRLSPAQRQHVRLICTRHLVRPARPSAVYADLDALIFVSGAARDAFLSTNPRIEASKIHVVPNSILAPRRPLRAPHWGPVRLLFAARIAPEKGLDTLLQALPLIENSELTICGTGEPKIITEYQRLAERLGISHRITWRGHVDDIFAELNKADIFVAPSRVPESFGLSVLEAMSQRVPTVATDIGALPELIENGRNGLLVPVDDPSALAIALRSLIDDSTLRATFAHAARATYLQHTYPAFYHTILELYTNNLTSIFHRDI